MLVVLQRGAAYTAPQDIRLLPQVHVKTSGLISDIQLLYEFSCFSTCCTLLLNGLQHQFSIYISSPSFLQTTAVNSPILIQVEFAFLKFISITNIESQCFFRKTNNTQMKNEPYIKTQLVSIL